MATKFFTGRRLAFTPLVVLIVLAVLLGLLLILTGCATVPKAAASDPQASQAATPEAVVEAPMEDAIHAFGETVTWDDNLSLSVSEPAPFTPSELAAGVVEGHTSVVFELVLTNNSDANVDPLVYDSAVSGGVDAPGIFDVSEGIGFPPSTVLLPGATIKWNQAYSVLDPASITMQISAGFSYDDAIFTNAQ